MAAKEYVSKDGGSTFYYRDPEKTVYHRERGLSALKWDDGDTVYFENNQRHRLDGAAYNHGFHKYHYLNGKKLFGKIVR